MNPLERAASLSTTGQKNVMAELMPTFQRGLPFWTSWDARKAISDGLKANSWVFACVRRLARSTASVPWTAFTQDVTDGQPRWVPDERHDLTTFVERPNPWMGRQFMMELTTAYLYLAGNAIWVTVEKDGRPVEAYPLNPAYVKPVPGRSTWIERYEYKRGDVKKVYTPDQVLHFMFPDPENPIWGLSPLQAAARTVDTDTEAVKWNYYALQNRAVADGAFVVPGALTPDQRKTMEEGVEAHYSDVKKKRKPFILGNGVDWKAMSLSPAEMDFIESRKVTREEICSVYGVPPPMVGIYDNATLANIETARRIFWQDTVIPDLEAIRDVLHGTLTAKFSGQSRGEAPNLWLSFDLTNVEAIREDLKEKAEIYERLVRNGVPPNTAAQRVELDVPPVDGGDVPLVQNNLVDLSMASGIDASTL